MEILDPILSNISYQIMSSYHDDSILLKVEEKLLWAKRIISVISC